jgi:hypothetical protein
MEQNLWLYVTLTEISIYNPMNYEIGQYSN